ERRRGKHEGGARRADHVAGLPALRCSSDATHDGRRERRRVGALPVVQMTASKTKFQQRLNRALSSKRLATALERALTTLEERRDAAMAQLDWPGLRHDLAERRAAAVEHMPELIDRFTREAEAVGARVYRAPDAAEALRVVAGLCRAKGAKLVVKSKSMATEEIHLNQHLEREGLRVVETDLGEWIIQLARDRPSHLIAPAIHKTREEV